MVIVDSQVHIWGANKPERPWTGARGHRPALVGRGSERPRPRRRPEVSEPVRGDGAFSRRDCGGGRTAPDVAKAAWHARRAADAPPRSVEELARERRDRLVLAGGRARGAARDGVRAGAGEAA